MSRKLALIIGNTEYTDPGLAQLSAPGKDAEDFARVLKDKEIGAFDDVKVIVNEPSASVIEAIDEFFDQKKPDDMLVLYFSGHGIRDEIGSLYLAFKNTIRSRLRSTAIKSDYIKEAMDQSRSKRQVLILDCCNSGAFPQGTKAELGGAMGMTKAFQGYGRFVLTASDATQFAWEGDKVIGETDNSLFTHFLVKGLEGEADSDGDGRITVDELYDYAYQQISSVTPKQTPTKSSSKQEGEIVLRQNMRIEDIKPVSLPDDLVEEIEDHRPYVREAAVQKLEKILKGKNLGMARSAADALDKIANDENTTRRVSQAATQVLETYKQTLQKAEEERLAKLEAERIAEEERRVRQQAEAEKLATAQKAEEERLTKAKLEAQQLAEEKKLAEEAEKQRLAAQKLEEERLAKAKIESDRIAEEKRLAEETEKQRIAKAKLEAQRLAEEKQLVNEAEKQSTQGDINVTNNPIRENKFSINDITNASKDIIEELIFNIKHARPSKNDIWYWLISLIATTSFMIQASSERSFDEELTTYVFGRGFFEFAFDESLRIIFIIGVIIQAWILSKNRHVYGFTWMIVALMPFAIILFDTLGVNSIKSDTLYLIIGNYTTIILLPSWLITTALLLFRKVQSS